MSGGRQLGTCPVVWIGLLALCGSLWAQSPTQFPPANSTQRGDGSHTNSSKTYDFGIMGQIARPGVYALDTPQPQLVDLIHHAGGLTQKATNQIRIVRQGNAGLILFYEPDLNFKLATGDIVVADGPRETQFSQRLQRTPTSSTAIRTADFAERQPIDTSDSFQHVALVGVLDRLVVLPAPKASANVRAILAYLGQAPTLATEVKVVPVGGRPVGADKENAVQENFAVPTVLYFPKHAVQPAFLPKFPEVYHMKEKPLAAPPPYREERRTAENSSSNPPSFNVPFEEPTPIERFQRPLPHSAMEPPLITEVRDLENRIPNPKPIPVPQKSPKSQSKSARKTVPQASNQETAEDQTGETAPWTYMGLVFLVLVAAGTYAKLRREAKYPASAEAKLIGVNVSSEETKLSFCPMPSQELGVAEPDPEQTKSSDSVTNDLIHDDVLQALLYNQMPVFEDSPEPVTKERRPEQPAPKKRFRVDRPAQQSASPAKPFFAKRPQPQEEPVSKSPHDIPSPETPQQVSVEPFQGNRKPVTNGPEIAPQPSLLDRVLQQVNQSRAA